MLNRHPPFDVICFDCDSTLSRIEGIDELARRAGCGAEIALMTNAAMDGRVAIDAMYAERLDRVRPNRAALAWLAERYAAETVPGAAETIATLQRLGKAVYIVSGGLRPAILPFARTLGLSPAEVYAVDVYFDPQGDTEGVYCGFDAASPLTRGDGKAIICRTLAARHGRIAMVGDGITDVAARDGGATIVGFGGVVEREAVRKAADCFIAAPTLIATLAVLLSDEEQ